MSAIRLGELGLQAARPLEGILVSICQHVMSYVSHYKALCDQYASSGCSVRAFEKLTHRAKSLL